MLTKLINNFKYFRITLWPRLLVNFAINEYLILKLILFFRKMIANIKSILKIPQSINIQHKYFSSIKSKLYAPNKSYDAIVVGGGKLFTECVRYTHSWFTQINFSY